MKSTTNLQKLKQIIPFKWRVQRGFKAKNDKHGVSMVAYVDARDVQDKLDEVVGIGGWQDEYYNVKSTLFCKIGILIDGVWCWKSGAGTESQFDKQKGEASDAFKRAGVKWGVNRDAYSVGIVYLEATVFVDKNGKSHYTPSINGTPLKGQKLYDLCNSKAKIEDLPNFEIKEESTLEKLA